MLSPAPTKAPTERPAAYAPPAARREPTATAGHATRTPRPSNQARLRARGDSVRDVLREPGRPLTPTLRAEMEARFAGATFAAARDGGATSASAVPVTRPNSGPEREADETANQVLEASTFTSETRGAPDFGSVRVHTGPAAERSARALGARAYALEHDVVFGAGPRPEDPAARPLLAHELAHVMQGGPAVARAVSSHYDQLASDLTYGVFDWAITDAEAREVLAILSGLTPVDFEDTLANLEADGLVDRLLENISDADRVTYAVLIETIQKKRSSEASAGYIENLMSYGLLDFVVTDAEAHRALEVLKTLKATPAKFKDIVAKIPAKQYERFYDNLSSEDRAANLRFLQDIEMIRSSGMTFDEMSAEQRRHLEAEATAASVSVGTYIGGETASRGYGGAPAVWWPSLSPAAKTAWVNRFTAAVADIKSNAPKEVKAVIDSAEAAGGGIIWDPEQTEENTAYAINYGTKLGVGKSWLQTAELDPANVYDNIMHELGGHREFGTTASWDIMQQTLTSLPAAEQAIVSAGVKSPYTAYGYMETELYAELREYPYRTPDSGGDDPEVDVSNQLKKIKDAFAPTVAEAIIRGFRRRIQADAQVGASSRRLYDRAVKDVFGISF